MMTPHLSIEAVWHDVSMIQILVKASNDRFSGTTKVYINADGADLINLGNRLHGYPKGIDQVEEQEFGFTKEGQEKDEQLRKVRPEIQSAVAYVHLKFLCIDPYGHTAVDVTLHEDPWNQRTEAKGRVYLEVRFEPAQIDRFAEELIALAKDKEGIAVLEGITSS